MPDPVMMTVGVVVSSWEIACAHRLKPKSDPSARCFIFSHPLSPVHPARCPSLPGTGPGSKLSYSIHSKHLCLPQEPPSAFLRLGWQNSDVSKLSRVVGPLTGTSTETGSHPPTQQERNQSFCEGRGSFRKLGAYVNILMK